MQRFPARPTGPRIWLHWLRRVRARQPAVVFVATFARLRRAPLVCASTMSHAIVDVVHARAVASAVFVDNCYGELVEDREPLEAGADLAIGSLIKNIGGGIAPHRRLYRRTR